MTLRRDAFVILLDRRSAGVAPEAWSGQVEHVDSAERARFASAEELLRFLASHAGGSSGAEPAEDLGR